MKTRSIMLLALLCASCGPSLEAVRRDGHVFVSTQRCTQGPLDVHVPALGSRWGETVTITASGRPIGGNYSISVDGVRVASGTFAPVAPPAPTPANGSTSAPVVATAAPPIDNQHCLAGASATVVATAGAPTTGDASVTGVPVATDPSNGATTATANDPNVPALRDVGEIVGDFHNDVTAIATWRWEFDPAHFEEAIPPLHLGADILIRIWSNEPNDLDGVRFLVTHSILRPTVPDNEYVAYLRRARAEHDAEAARQLVENERRAHEESERANRRVAFCDSHHGDTGCWGPGGYDGAVARQRRADFCAGHHEDTACWGPGGYEGMLAAQRERAARDATASAAQPHEPPGPPPAPRLDVRPPAPSIHAEWVPGYWHWNGFSFGWFVGHWTVPDADRAADLTVHAPALPPPVRVESRPEPPASNAVWTDGYWQWNGTAFVWVGGAWQLPPDANVRWRAATWRTRGAVIVFDPGAWIP